MQRNVIKEKVKQELDNTRILASDKALIRLLSKVEKRTMAQEISYILQFYISHHKELLKREEIES